MVGKYDGPNDDPARILLNDLATPGASGITSELQLYCTAIRALVFAALMLFAGWFHYHKAASKLAWFQDVESMLNHHLAGLLGLGSLS